MFLIRGDNGSGKVLLNRYVSINESHPALLDLATGEKKILPPLANGKVAYHNLAFLPDGQSAYLTADARGEFQQLARLDLNTLEYQFTNSDIPWDVTTVTVEPKTGLTVFTVNEDGASALYLLRGKKRERIAVPLGVISWRMEFSPDGKHWVSPWNRLRRQRRPRFRSSRKLFVLGVSKSVESSTLAIKSLRTCSLRRCQVDTPLLSYFVKPHQFSTEESL